MEATPEKILTVTELTRRIKGVLETQIGQVWVEGELSNVRQPSSGHFYFTIKDAGAQITGVLFRGNQRGMAFRPRDGLQVRVLGDVSVYEKSGNYQIVVRRMIEAGKGALQARFEALKQKLLAEGLFDEARKRPIPLLPRHVGIVTSPTGAAIRDILKVILRRFPNLHVVVAPVKVQGDGAAEDIAAGIELLNRRGGLDAMIVGRGGGSLEDLWAFNEEVVARAIFQSRIPVISAVGHEIDFTISDFVADLRAPTPSAAAELVVGRKEEFEEQLAVVRGRLAAVLRESLLRARNRLLHASRSYVFREPSNLVRQHMQRLDALELRMAHRLQGGLSAGRQRLTEAAQRTQHALALRRERCRQDVRRLEQQMRAYNPHAVLDRGYSLTTDADGRIVREAASVRAGQRVRTRVARGEFESAVV